MPRRKGQGISPTKRIPTKDGTSQSRRRTEDVNEDTGGGPSRVQMPEPDVPPASSEDNKYLHKKFKKMATSSATLVPEAATSSASVEEDPRPIPLVNGTARPPGQDETENGGETPRPVFDLTSSGSRSTASRPRSEESPVPSPIPSLSGVGSSGRHVCPYCKLACAKPSVLQKHIRAHTNERPYPCVPCGFAFKTKSNLYKHCRSRAHALKMEEHGTKFSYPLDEPSDVDDDDDENNSNNTPPPSSSFSVQALSTLVAPVSANERRLSVSPSAVQATPESSDRRPIYKPKFHKAAMYQEEEDNPPQSNKKAAPNLSLKIPTATVPSFTSVGSILSNSPASPSPEFLQRHISKIISENQAIVETMDLWPKKHSRARDKEGSPASPLSASTSPGIDANVWHKKSFPRQMSLTETVDERLRAHHAAQSKLALALLRPSVPCSPPRPIECATTPEPTYGQQPLNLTTNHAKDDPSYGDRKRCLPEIYRNSVAKQPDNKDHHAIVNKTLTTKGRVEDFFSEGFHKNVDKFFHPQNPEGSIIKDLLLKARAASAAGVSIQGIQEMVDSEFVAAALPHLQAQDDYQTSQNAQYVCQLCKIPYRNTENLEIHQLYYCKGDNMKPATSPRHSPPLMYSTAGKYSHEERVSPKSKAHSKMKAKMDLKISPIKDNSKICQPFPSPGPLLGNTPLVESYYYAKKDEDDFGRHQKKQRLDSETSSRSSPNSVHEVRSISSPFAPMSTGGTTTLRSLEELSKCPMRPNSLQMFGGEVSILNGAGETKTMRIEPRGKSPSAAEYLNLPNVHQSGGSGPMGSKCEAVEGGASATTPHVVTIARSGLNSGGTIVQVPLKANASASLVKPPRSSGGSVNSRSGGSPLSLSPMQRSSRHSLGSPPNPHYSTSTYLSQNTPTLTTSYPETPKLMPNITTPNLAVPGIPAPSMSGHMPFMPFSSILPDGTLINPLTSITAFNPLTLPRAGMLHSNLLNMSMKDGGKMNAEGYPGGVVTIMHGGKVIPYVPGMPGPQTMMIPANLGIRKATSPKPLDLASPSKEHVPIFKIDSAYEMSQQPHFQKNKVRKSSVTYPTSPAVIVQPGRKSTVAKETPVPRPAQKACVPSAPSSMVSPQKTELVVAIPSIKVNNVPQNNETVIEDMKRPAPLTVRKSLKRSESILAAVVKDNVKDNDSECMEVDTSTSKGSPNRPKFLRPTSLPLKPGTFVPKQHLGSGLTPNGGNVLSLVSPETPRPKKSYGQLYLNGHSYTYLALKCSTRPFFCTLNRPQPMYVVQSPEHSTLSMYSNWKVCLEADPNPLGLDPGKAMAFYDSRPHLSVTFTIAKPSEKLPMTLTHSSYWAHKSLVSASTVGARRTSPDKEEQREGAIEGMENLSLSESNPKRVKIFDGGFESNEEYIYVRGRGRGRYVCEECGIRCKKPSMLKKHIRTHTDVRPFTCKHCNFSFKTKGNLTKHMKSKAHYKKCVELGIVPVPTIVDDSYIDEECLARQQALRASRHGSGDTDSEDNEDDEDEDEDEDDDDDDMGDEEGKQEREAACSLLSLAESTRFSASTNHRYLSLGLIPLPSMSTRPSTYPYTLEFALAQPDAGVTEPQTPTLTNLTAQTEREKVSRNTGLALELREDKVGEALDTLNRRNGSLIPPTGEKNRCYFPSRRTPTMMNSLSEKSWSDDDSEGFDYDNSDGISDDTDLSDNDRDIKPGHGKSHKDREAGRKESGKDAQAKEMIDDKNIAKILCDNLPVAHMKSLRELRESYELSMGIKPKEEVIDVEMSELGPPGPMDLSSKSMSLRRKLSLSLPYYGVANGAATPTTPISEILTPVSEPAVLASLCSSMERFPVAQTLPAKLAVDVKETTMLQAYLTEKALQDVRLKQHQHRHNQGYVATSSVPKASDVWPRHVKREENREMSQAREVVSKSGKKLQMEGKCADSSDSVVRLQVPTDLENFWDNAAGIGTDDKTRRSRSPAGSEASTVRHDLASVKVKHAEKLIDRSNSDMEEAFSRLDTFTTDSNKEKNYANEDSLKMKEAFKMQGSDMGDKFGCVSMASNIVRNVVVGGVGFAGHQPSSPPSSDKKSPSPGKPKAEFMPPSIGPSSSYCSVLEDGRSVCVICNKIFSKPSQLRLHVNIHYFERPFRCESCAVSFRTKGHLQKHERSVSHQNKVSMNSTFGTATMTNPRPFKCDDCKIAFRIHGHLAKHLRSKMHIMKLECVGKLPFGTYAEMEREGVSLNDIDTSDCDNSLESLQILAQKLYEKDPSKLGQWDGERGVLMNPNPVLSSGDTSSDEGEPCLSPMNHAPLRLQTSQEELDFKSLSLQSGHVKAENARSPSPLLGGFEYLAGGSHVNAYDPRMRHEQFALGMLPPKVTAFSSKDGRPRIETVTRDVVEEKRRGLGRDRKRKSVDDLDYTDTSDGDNEANSNQKYPCGICFQDFNTQAALHVHSFVEHDSSAAGDEKTPKLCGSPADLRPNDRSRDADSLVTERGCDEGLKQVPKSTSSEGKHWRRAYAPPNVKYVREGDAETDDTDIVGDTKQNPSVK